MAVTDLAPPTSPTTGPGPEVARVLKRWRESEKALIEDRRNYWLNRSFYNGHQWVRWDNNSRLVTSTLPTTTYETERIKVTINKLQSRANLLIGRMTQRNLVFEGLPTAPDDSTVTKSKIAEAVIEEARIRLGWESTRASAVFSAVMGGTAGVMIEWNRAGGSPLPAPDPQGLTLADGAKAQVGSDSGPHLQRATGSGAVIGTGEIQLTPLSIAEFSLETGVRSQNDARWCISCIGVPPSAAKATYNLDFTPTPDVASGTSPLRRQLLSALEWSEQVDLTAVYTLYEIPNPDAPKGRHVVVINDKAILVEDWPFPFKDRLNIYTFPVLAVDGQWNGQTMMSQARAPQILYNIARSGLAEHMKLASNARMLIPKGSLDDETEMTDEPGELIEYFAEPGVPAPQYMAPPMLQRWYTQEAAQLEAEIDDIMASHAVSRGEAPGDRNSGLALSILGEKNDTPLGPMSRDQANGWARVAEMGLQLYACHVDEMRVTIRQGALGVPQKLEWNASMIGDQWRMLVPLDSVIPTSRVAVQAQLIQLVQAFPQIGAAISPERLVRMLEVPGAQSLTELADSDVNRAIYENERMAAGQVEIPKLWHDHAKHIAEHNQFRNSPAYDALATDLQDLFESHVRAHDQLQMDQVVSQMQLNSVKPGLGGMPQSDAPIGSALPPDHSLAAQMASQGPPPNGSVPP